jgi:hypothetical protein
VLQRHAGLAHDDPRRRIVTLAKPLGRVVSPLALTPRVPYEERFIFAGLADRLVNPRNQVTRRVQCRNWAIRGGTVCRLHGGAAPQVLVADNQGGAIATCLLPRRRRLSSADWRCRRLKVTDLAR